MSLKVRFEDSAVRVSALLAQRIVQGQRQIAEEISKEGTLLEFVPGENLTVQGDTNRDVFFMLTGKVQVIINGVRLYYRDHGTSVGEMSASNPHIPRAATLEVVEPTVAWKISHERFEQIANAHPILWRLVAIDLSARLEQRNTLLNRTNSRPRVFMICSAEALPIARAIRVGLSHDAEIVLWNDELVFAPGGYPIEALEAQVNSADFGIALAEPDDLQISRDQKSAVPRDNVIFELGFFMSRLGRHRTILLVPENADVKLPSDFKGLTPLPYDACIDSKKLATALGPTIDKILTVVAQLGVRASIMEPR